MLAKHERMCWWVARRVGRGLSPDDLEDVAAEVRRWFVRAAQTFDPTQGCQFSTYAMRAATGWARRKVRLIRARGLTVPSDYAAPVPGVGDLNAPLPGNGGEVIDLVAAPAEAERRDWPADFWDRARRHLTARQFDYLAAYFRDGLTHAAAGERFGVTRAAVQQGVRDALAKLRESGAFDGCRELL